MKARQLNIRNSKPYIYWLNYSGDTVVQSNVKSRTSLLASKNPVNNNRFGDYTPMSFYVDDSYGLKRITEKHAQQLVTNVVVGFPRRLKEEEPIVVDNGGNNW
jgi:hypothetical protein